MKSLSGLSYTSGKSQNTTTLKMSAAGSRNSEFISNGVQNSAQGSNQRSYLENS
jgi:hypothetical protein